MATLYVTEPRATVRSRREGLEVTIRASTAEVEPGGRSTAAAIAPLRVGLRRLEVVVLVGGAHITAEAMQACSGAGVAVVLMDHGGRVRARMTPDSGRSADLRLLQYAAQQDAPGRRQRAAAIVEAKVWNAVAVLVDRQSNAPDNSALPPAIAALKIQARAARAADSIESLRGHEGTAARIYFQALATTFRGPITFSGRQSRPAPDPANALLSFGYTLLANLLAGRIDARGLDPALGFFHEVHAGRPSLALDLLEELRHPIVDRFVTRACNLRIFRPEHFAPDPDRPGGLRLVPPALRRFFGEWEEFLKQPLRVADIDHESRQAMPVEDESQEATPEEAPGTQALCLPSVLLDVRSLLDRQIERLVTDLRVGLSYWPFRYRP